MEKEEVADELSLLLDLRPDTALDMEMLEESFNSIGFRVEWIQREIAFGDVMKSFTRGFHDAAANQAELQDKINLLKNIYGELRNISHGIEVQTGHIEKQTEDLERIADKVAPDMTLEWQTYFTRMRDDYNYLPLRGMDVKAADASTKKEDRMGLADVYIDLDTTATVKSDDKKEQGKASRDFESGRDGKTKPLSALLALTSSNRMVLLGDPGGGKSTFVDHLCLCLANHKLAPSEGWLTRLPEWPENWSNLIPIPIVLREFSAWVEKKAPEKKGSGLFLEYLRFRLEQVALDSLYDELRSALFKGNALLLLDGLDEVPVNEKLNNRIKGVITDLPKAFRDTPMLVTCRVLSYQEESRQLGDEKWLSFELAKLDEEKIRKFIAA